MIDEIKKNIDTELAILKEISDYEMQLSTSAPEEIKLINESIISLTSSIKIINDSIPQLLNKISSVQELPQEKINGKNRDKTNLEKVNFEKSAGKVEAVVQSKDRETFLKELRLNEELIKRLKAREKIKEEKPTELRAARGYLKMSNKFFLKTSTDWINKGYFTSLASDLKKANIEILFQTYVAMILFTVLISAIIGLFLATGLFFWNQSLISSLAVIIFLPVLTFLIIYYYPSTEQNSIGKRVDQELPFAVIHMSAISGSGIEPTQIFKIIALSREYKTLAKEIRKVMNQINLYGYDLVTAINNVSKITSSKKLSELFSGLSTTINSGGSLTEFFEKRAETLLIEYRLEREKFTKTAETFMDIYISVVIAAPMILMLLIIIISISGIKIAFSSGQLTGIIIGVIILVNIIFLGALHIKQPKY